MKTCTKCKIEKSYSDFGKDVSKKDGLTSWCRNCWKTYRKLHKKDISARNKKYREENPEIVCRALKEWKDRNPTYSVEYYRKNVESCAKKVKLWRHKNQEKVFNYNTKRRAKMESFTPLKKEEWIKIMSMTDWKCFYCNVSLTKDNRTIDHVLSLESGGPHKLDNCVPACISCNCSKKDVLIYKWTFFKSLTESKQEYLMNILYKLGVER